jgi:hypothetical protein
MLKTIKWLWLKAEQRATERLLSELYARRQYHSQQSEIAYYKDRYETKERADDDMLRWRLEPELTAKEHGLIADELSSILNHLQPTKANKEIDNE